MGGPVYAGSLIAGATVVDNQAVLSSPTQYVNLPSGLFGNYTSVSVEAWVTTGTSQCTWASIFQFGAMKSSDENSLYVQFCTDNAACTLNNFDLGWWYFSGKHAIASTATSFSGQTNMHMVVTVTQGGYARIYLNGILAGTTTSVINPLPPAKVFVLGSFFNANFVGSVDEFRIWGGVLSPADITARYRQGPGKRGIVGFFLHLLFSPSTRNLLIFSIFFFLL